MLCMSKYEDSCMRAKGVQSFIVDCRGLRSCEQSVHRYFCGIKFADAPAISRATTWSEEKDSERLGSEVNLTGKVRGLEMANVWRCGVAHTERILIP